MAESAVPSHPTLIAVEEARRRIVEVCSKRPVASEAVALAAAAGRVLAADVVAPFDVPGFANSAMDGFALRGEDLRGDGPTRLALAGQILAGGREIPRIASGTCVRITTGAPLPQDADTVVMKEHAAVEGEVVAIEPGAVPGMNVRPAGEDYRRGDLALPRGTRLAPAHIGALASFGMTDVAVSRRPRAVLITTGDELVAPGNALGFGQIHDSNRYSLGGLLEQHGVELLRHERVRDEPARLREALVRAGREADIVVSSGGVSAGEADYLPALIAEAGRVHFWKVRIKPGMPFLFGAVGGAHVFALPGNPVSGIAIFLTLLRPGLDAMSGASDNTLALRARLTHAIDKRHARAEFQRARLACDAEGVLRATAFPRQGSGMLRGVVEANALIVLPEGSRAFAAGDVVEALALPGFAGQSL